MGTATAQIVKALNGGRIYGTASVEKADFVEEMGMIHIPRGEDFVQLIKGESDGVHHALDPVVANTSWNHTRRFEMEGDCMYSVHPLL